MFVLDDDLIHSAGDLALAARCEFAVLRTLDAHLGRLDADAVAGTDDAMLARLSRLGSQHEARQWAAYRRQFGDDAIAVERPGRMRSELAAAAAVTLDAAARRAPVIYQGTFFGDGFLGFSDFLVYDEDVDAYEVQDTKLSRTERVPSILQLAAYAEALTAAGIPVSNTARLVLGDGTRTAVHLPDVLPVHRRARAELVALLDAHRTQLLPADWADADVRACFRCEHCAPEVEASRDLLLVAGMRVSQRTALLAADITTIDALAASSGPVPDLSARSLAGLRDQARVQVRQESTGSPVVEFHTPSALGALPGPDDGDIFFDFEGDPLHTENGSTEWGLEYLFGVLETDRAFRPFWAHDRDEERRAFTAFVDYVRERRRQYPAMHVYHYAAYEKSALLRLAARHGVYEDEVDDLLREQVLVDLYPVVRSALRIGARSYSIKKLEPAYMSEVRGDVADAVASITEYARWRDLRDRGELDEAASVLAEIADYNRYDCESTLELRNWLLAHAAEAGVTPRGPIESAPPTDDDESPNPARDALREFAGAPGDRTPERQTAALLAAAVDYHRREDKPFWWAHFDRLSSPVDEWGDTRDVFVVESVESMSEWVKPSPRHNVRRTSVLRGEFGPGSAVRGAKVAVLYAPPAPEWIKPELRANPQYRWTATGTIVAVSEDGASVTLEESIPKGADPHDLEPVATAPTPGPATTTVRAAIAATAVEVADALPHVPDSAVLDLLLRRRPRTRSGSPLRTDDPSVAGITAALLDLDGSYVAVQGPPGTGKTYTGSRVVAALVRDHGWRVGVVGQSHAVVENFLDAVVDAGLDGTRVHKKPVSDRPRRWTASVKDVDVAALDGGCVVGGTAWTMTNRKNIAENAFDLLVIDEAGQFCLANTVAVGRAARNLLLLGDPQQLPQVSQGSHPEPVDASALGWLADGADTLPADRGWFLATTRRMHPDVCRVVSDLSYEGRLRAHESVDDRSLDGVAPGVHTTFVDHVGNATSSREEADEVVRLARSVIGRTWRTGAESRPLESADVLVVAAYNAQVAVIRAALDAAGLTDTACGTVDRFQGREAAVVIVSMAASAPEDVPRGMPFLLSRNRINVALSRGQWVSYVVRSPALTHYLPGTPVELSLLGAFMRVSPDLVQPKVRPSPR